MPIYRPPILQISDPLVSNPSFKKKQILVLHRADGRVRPRPDNVRRRPPQPAGSRHVAPDHFADRAVSPRAHAGPSPARETPPPPCPGRCPPSPSPAVRRRCCGCSPPPAPPTGAPCRPVQRLRWPEPLRRRPRSPPPPPPLVAPAPDAAVPLPPASRDELRRRPVATVFRRRLGFREVPDLRSNPPR